MLPTSSVTPGVFPAAALQWPEDFRSEFLSVQAAFGRFGRDLERLRRLQSAGMPGGELRDWQWARPTARGWKQRVFVLRHGDTLAAALLLRERTVCGLGTGMLRGGDALGEPFLICDPHDEPLLLGRALEAIFQAGRHFVLLLDRPLSFTLPLIAHSMRTRVASWSSTVPLHWIHQLAGTFDSSIAGFGHRTRRNLRYARRQVEQNRWQFLTELTHREQAEAAAALARSSTHPVSPRVVDARLRVSRQVSGSFSMGLKHSDGRWLSVLSGTRSKGVTDVFWQSNTRGVSASLCTALRALLIEEEVRRQTRMIRYIGGTNPLMEHCCDTESSTQTLFMRNGVRSLFLQTLMKTSVPSANHPLRRYFGLGLPAGSR